MSDALYINNSGVCCGCDETPSQGECVQCFVCKSLFHAICDKAGNDIKLGSKTMITTFLAQSTKNNFKFYCDKCLTELEINMVATKDEKISKLEKIVEKMVTKMDKISNLLEKKEADTSSQKVENKNVVPNIWFDKNKVESIKAPLEKSVLIIKKADDQETCLENQNIIESTIVSNNIPVIESFKNKSGDLMVICESEDSRKTLKDLVSSTNEEIIMNTPSELRPSITIVGLSKDYTKEEIIKMLVMQNNHIKKFSISNKIDDHIQIFAVKPLKNNPLCFQAFARVTAVLREGLHYSKNKVILGLKTCKIYDRYDVKRCLNCQKFGHFAKDCPDKNVKVCSKCSGNHYVNDCDSFQPKCINCVRNNLNIVDHEANSSLCPVFVKEQDIAKNKMNKDRLNWITKNQPHR